MQIAYFLRRIILSSVACLAIQDFSAITHKRNDFRKKKKKVTEHEMCVFIFSRNFDRQISHSTRIR